MSLVLDIRTDGEIVSIFTCIAGCWHDGERTSLTDTALWAASRPFLGDSSSACFVALVLCLLEGGSPRCCWFAFDAFVRLSLLVSCRGLIASLISAVSVDALAGFAFLAIGSSANQGICFLSRPSAASSFALREKTMPCCSFLRGC